MKIVPKSVVSVSYELFVGDEAEDQEFDMIELVDEENPMVFLHTLSGLPEAFEEKLLGLSAGDEFDFVLTSDEGYGDFDNEAVAELPRSMFEIEDGSVPDGMLEEGNAIPFTNEDGHQLIGRIVATEGNSVIVDFNHPLAGRFLHFRGKVTAVREATESELAHGHVHGPGGIMHEGDEE